MDASILKLLAASGDTASIVLVWVMWKFDRRLLKLEFGIGGEHGNKKESS